MGIIAIMTSTLMYLGLLSFVTLSAGQEFREIGISEHNEYRELHGGPDLIGEDEIHASAQSWAEYLALTGRFEHTPNSPYGENIYESKGPSTDLEQAVVDAVKDWHDEIDLYDFDNPGPSPGTGHFTQLVWKESTRLGIGATFVSDPIYGNRIVVVAQYDPPGNVRGQYEENVVPEE